MKQPKAPNPYQQAGAQQKAELGATMASGITNNPNIYTPYGSQTYQNAGYETIYDAQGKAQYVPRYNQIQTLTPDQQKLLGLQTQTQYNMGQAGVTGSSKLRDMIGSPVTAAGWQGWNAGPQAANLATTFGGNNPMQMALAGGGNIQKGLAGQEVRQDTGATDRPAIEQAMMGRFNTDAARQNAAQQAQLAARGMNAGSGQYGQQQQAQDRARTDALQQAYLGSGQEARAAQDAYNQAANQRFQQGATQGQFANAAQLQQFQQNAAQGQFANLAQQQAYEQALGRGQFSNQALESMYSMGGQTADRANQMRQAQMQESLGLRNQSINEIMAMMQGGQVSAPQFSPYSAQGVGAANPGAYMGQNYANALNATSQFNSGLFSLGSAVGGGIARGSDRRLKENIHRLDGHRWAGLPLYWFSYKAEPKVLHIGVMADEVKQIHPEAIVVVDGYDWVDYGLLAKKHEGVQP